VTILAVLLALACGSGFGFLLYSGRHRWAILPPAVLGVLIITTLTLTLEIREGQRPNRELRLYFSLADANVIEKVLACRDANARSGCPIQLRHPADRVVAVFSRRAVTDMAAQMPTIDRVRSLEGATMESEYGLTVEGALEEIAREPPGGDTLYLLLTPRARSVSTARTAYRKLLQDRPDLRSRLVFLDEKQLDIPRDRLVPQIHLDAPPVIGANGGDYKVTITGENRTNGTIEIDGQQLIAIGGRIEVHSLQVGDETIELVAASQTGTAHSIAPEKTFAIRGSFATAAMGSVTTHSIVVRNSYGETLTHLREITRVEKPVLGVLRPAGRPSGGDDFLRFARSSSVDIEEVFVDFDGLADPSKRAGILDRTAQDLSLWGMLVVAEPLTTIQADNLREVLQRTPQSRIAPSLLFIGAGTSETLFNDLTNPTIAGWQAFLSPLGIGDLSGARRVLIAVDQSGSLRSFSPAVQRAVEVLYDRRYGLGARDANLLVAFCGRSENICTKNALETEVRSSFDRNNWEGSTHLVKLRDYAVQQGRSIFNSDAYTTVSDLVLFWDGRDIGGERADRGDDRLSNAALRALNDIVARKIQLHIATFTAGLRPDEQLIKRYEVLSGFSREESGQRFRDAVVLSVLRRGLEVRVGTIENLNDIAQRRIRTLGVNGISVVNTLFGPNTLRPVEAAGAVVPLRVRHPSGFDVPLMALKDPVSFPTSDPTHPLNLRIGYLGLDLASEFAAIEIDTERRRQANVGDVVYSAVDAMGAQLRASSVQWRFDGDLVLAQRDNFLPFDVERGIRGGIRVLEPDGTSAETSRRHYLGWNELGLDRFGVDLSGADLMPGRLYELSLEFCHFPTAAAQAAGQCAQTNLNAAVVGAYPVLTNPTAIDAAGAKMQHPPEGLFSISESVAKLTFAAMTVAIAIGAFLL